MHDKSDADHGSRPPPSGSPDDLHFACLFFGGNDEVRWTEIIRATRKAVAMQRAMSEMRTSPGCVGFQLWHDGSKIAEYFPSRHAAAGRLVTGPKPRRS